MSPKSKKQKSTPVRRRGGDPANLEKSRDRTKKHLVTGGKPKGTLTIPQLEYCAWRARGTTIADSARVAGIRKSSVYKLEHRDLVQQTIEEIKNEHKEAVVASVDEIRQTVRIASFAALIDAMQNWKTHAKRGDDARAKAIETGCKVSGLIKPAQHINQSNSTAFAAAQAEVGLKVIIEHIGRPQDQAAAQASFAGKSLE